VVKAADVAQLGDGVAAPLRDEHAEGSSRSDRGQLGGVADEENLGVGLAGGSDELVEGEGPGQGGLVDDDQLARPEPAGDDPLVEVGNLAGEATGGGRAGMDPVVEAGGEPVAFSDQVGEPSPFAEPFGGVVGGDTELVAEDLGGDGRGSDPVTLPAP